MLTINPNEEKTIHFVVEINGIGCDEMNGYVRFGLDNIEYGFPVYFEGDEIIATIPALNEVFDGKLKNDMVLDARLELAAPDHNYYFRPWEDEIAIKMPVSVEAKIMEDGGSGGRPSVRAKVRTERVKPTSTPSKKKQQPIQESGWSKSKLQNITEDQIYKYMERAGTKNKTIQEIIFNEAVSAAAEAGDKGNLGILKHVVRALKKPK
jgi:hypothetical protein